MVAEREEVQLTEEREDVQYHKQRKRNEMEIVFDAVSCNESFARVAVAAFITHLNPTLEELAKITGAEVPKPIAELKNLEVRFNNVTDADKMPEYVKNTLGI